MSEPELLLRVQNDLAELERVAGLVERFGAAHRLSEKSVFEINLALDEVLTNVISYAYDDTGPHEIAVRFSLLGDLLTIEVRDDGRPFDPLSAPPADLDLALEERAIGGLGVHFLRRTMDRLEYRREAGENVLTMHKRAGASS